MAIRVNKKGKPEFNRNSDELRAALKSYTTGFLVRALMSVPGKEPPPPDPRFEAAEKRLSDENFYRIEQLFSHFDIDPSSPHGFALLAVKLAEEFVPNFSVYKDQGKRPGRPKGRKIPVGHQLVEAIEEIAQERKQGFADACRILSGRTRRNGPPNPWKGTSPKTLETRYYESKFEIEQHDQFSQLIKSRHQNTT